MKSSICINIDDTATAVALPAAVGDVGGADANNDFGDQSALIDGIIGQR